MTPDQATFARRMLYASICAYNITGDRHDAQPIAGADRVVPSEDGYCYSVLNAYQAEVGFAGAPESYTPAFFADGAHDTNAALAGLTEDGYAVIALRGTLPPSLHGSDLLQWSMTGPMMRISNPWSGRSMRRKRGKSKAALATRRCFFGRGSRHK